MKVTTTLTTEKGVIVHSGTSGFTVTGTRKGEGMDTRIEHSATTSAEMREMVAVLLCMLDEKEGEQFVASCLNRYVEETGKQVWQDGKTKMVVIRGRK